MIIVIAMSGTGVDVRAVMRAWGLILAGYRPNISIEITRECPLRCPGCYAYGDDHLGGDVTLRGLADYKGDELVSRFMALVDRHRPLHVSIVGGEPLVRYRELGTILPQLAERGHSHAGSSRARCARFRGNGRISRSFRSSRRSTACSRSTTRGARRRPTTGSSSTSRDTRSRSTARSRGSRCGAPGYLEEFLGTWQANPNTRLIWMSLYTPQVGEISEERLRPADRATVIAELRRLKPLFSKLQLPDAVLNVYAAPPDSPENCIFREDDRMLFVRPGTPHHAVPVRRQSRLLELRVPRVGGARSDRPPSPGRRPSDRDASFTRRFAWAARSSGFSGSEQRQGLRAATSATSVFASPSLLLLFLDLFLHFLRFPSSRRGRSSTSPPRTPRASA